MKKKFDRYTIEVCDKDLTRMADGSLVIEATLKGDIEIGIEIDKWTWRGDWFVSLFQNHVKDISKRYRIHSVVNNDEWDSVNKTEINRVVMCLSER